MSSRREHRPSKEENQEQEQPRVSDTSTVSSFPSSTTFGSISKSGGNNNELQQRLIAKQRQKEQYDRIRRLNEQNRQYVQLLVAQSNITGAGRRRDERQQQLLQQTDHYDNIAASSSYSSSAPSISPSQSSSHHESSSIQRQSASRSQDHHHQQHRPQLSRRPVFHALPDDIEDFIFDKQDTIERLLLPFELDQVISVTREEVPLKILRQIQLQKVAKINDVKREREELVASARRHIQQRRRYVTKKTKKNNDDNNNNENGDHFTGSEDGARYADVNENGDDNNNNEDQSLHREERFQFPELDDEINQLTHHSPILHFFEHYEETLFQQQQHLHTQRLKKMRRDKKMKQLRLMRKKQEIFQRHPDDATSEFVDDHDEEQSLSSAASLIFSSNTACSNDDDDDDDDALSHFENSINNDDEENDDGNLHMHTLNDGDDDETFEEILKNIKVQLPTLIVGVTCRVCHQQFSMVRDSDLISKVFLKTKYGNGTNKNNIHDNQDSSSIMMMMSGARDAFHNKNNNNNEAEEELGCILWALDSDEQVYKRNRMDDSSSLISHHWDQMIARVRHHCSGSRHRAALIALIGLENAAKEQVTTSFLPSLVTSKGTFLTSTVADRSLDATFHSHALNKSMRLLSSNLYQRFKNAKKLSKDEEREILARQRERESDIAKLLEVRKQKRRLAIRAVRRAKKRGNEDDDAAAEMMMIKHESDNDRESDSSSSSESLDDDDDDNDDDDYDLMSILDDEDQEFTDAIEKLRREAHNELLNLYSNAERSERYHQLIFEEQQALLDNVMNNKVSGAGVGELGFAAAASNTAATSVIFNNTAGHNARYFPTFPPPRLVPREIVFINGYPAIASRAFGGHEIFERGQNTNNNSTAGYRNGVGFSAASSIWQTQLRINDVNINHHHNHHNNNNMNHKDGNDNHSPPAQPLLLAPGLPPYLESYRNYQEKMQFRHERANCGVGVMNGPSRLSVSSASSSSSSTFNSTIQQDVEQLIDQKKKRDVFMTDLQIFLPPSSHDEKQNTATTLLNMLSDSTDFLELFEREVIAARKKSTIDEENQQSDIEAGGEEESQTSTAGKHRLIKRSSFFAKMNDSIKQEVCLVQMPANDGLDAQVEEDDGEVYDDDDDKLRRLKQPPDSLKRSERAQLARRIQFINRLSASSASSSSPTSAQVVGVDPSRFYRYARVGSARFSPVHKHHDNTNNSEQHHHRLIDSECLVVRNQFRKRAVDENGDRLERESGRRRQRSASLIDPEQRDASTNNNNNNNIAVPSIVMDPKATNDKSDNNTARQQTKRDFVMTRLERLEFEKANSSRAKKLEIHRYLESVVNALPKLQRDEY